MIGVVKLVPVATKFPPVDASYQFIVPAEAVADKATVPVPQISAGVVEVMLGTVFTVAITDVLVADGQPLLKACT